MSKLAELRRSLATLDPSVAAAEARAPEGAGPLVLSERWALSAPPGPAWLARRVAETGLAPGLAKLEAKAAAPLDAGGALAALLPEGGLPRGAVVELASPHGLGCATSFALAACAAAQREAGVRAGDARTVGAWCAFVDPWSTLHAPGLAQRGVDLSRLLVVRPSVEALARVAVRVVESQAFRVVVIDAAGLPGPAPSERVRLERWVTVVRRLAMAVEHRTSTVILLTDACAARPMPLPVALRLELRRRFEPRDVVRVRVAKERHGRVGAELDFAR